jgi:hypothetical protein
MSIASSRSRSNTVFTNISSRGWEGLCDGYYTYGIFNTTQGPANGYNPAIGDQYGIGATNYDRDFTVFVFEL